MNRNRVLIALCFLLVVLIFVSHFRYTQLDSKSGGSSVLKWTKDNWTGITWISYYRVTGAKEYPSDIGYIGDTISPDLKEKIDEYLYERQRMTNIWILAFIINIGLIAWVIVKRDKTAETDK